MGHKLIIKCKTIRLLKENIGKKSSQSWARQKKKKTSQSQHQKQDLSRSEKLTNWIWSQLKILLCQRPCEENEKTSYR